MSRNVAFVIMRDIDLCAVLHGGSLPYAVLVLHELADIRKTRLADAALRLRLGERVAALRRELRRHYRRVFYCRIV